MPPKTALHRALQNIPLPHTACNCWNSVAVMFELRCSKVELRCSESGGQPQDQGVGGARRMTALTRVPSAFAAALRDPPLRRPLASAASERSLASASRLLCDLELRCTWFTLG